MDYEVDLCSCTAEVAATLGVPTHCNRPDSSFGDSQWYGDSVVLIACSFCLNRSGFSDGRR